MYLEEGVIVFVSLDDGVPGVNMPLACDRSSSESLFSSPRVKLGAVYSFLIFRSFFVTSSSFILSSELPESEAGSDTLLFAVDFSQT